MISVIVHIMMTSVSNTPIIANYAYSLCNLSKTNRFIPS